MMPFEWSDKEKEIKIAIAAKDVAALREHCLTTGGLLHGKKKENACLAFSGFSEYSRPFFWQDTLRQQAWPLLVDSSSQEEEPLPRILSTKDQQCVQWDVKRWIGSKGELLVQVIERSCRFYYQGYHQVASVMLETMKDTALSAHILQRLYHTHLGKFVSADDLPLARFLQWMVLPTIWFLDADLHLILAEQEPTFCAPWILTWFSALEEPRLFDAFIAAHSLLPFYCSMVLVLDHKEQILKDSMTVHKPLPIDNAERLLCAALQLMGTLPPHKLWVIASHYHGEGPVEELLRQGPLADALLTLAAPERPSLIPATPLSRLACGIGRPSSFKKKRNRLRRRRALFLCCLCVFLAVLLAWRQWRPKDHHQHTNNDGVVETTTGSSSTTTCKRRSFPSQFRDRCQKTAR